MYFALIPQAGVKVRAPCGAEKQNQNLKLFAQVGTRMKNFRIPFWVKQKIKKPQPQKKFFMI